MVAREHFIIVKIFRGGSRGGASSRAQPGAAAIPHYPPPSYDQTLNIAMYIFIRMVDLRASYAYLSSAIAPSVQRASTSPLTVSRIRFNATKMITDTICVYIDFGTYLSVSS